MIYTLGKTAVYEQYFSEEPHPKKRKGGSVWQTRKEAEEYREMMNDGFEWSVYGVEANWATQTKDIPLCSFNELLADAPLVKLE